VAVDGRGSLPFTLLQNESLVATASWALGEAGAELLDFNALWGQVQESGRAVVLHDPLCPLTPVPFLRFAIESSAADDVVVVGVRPVTDTIKAVADNVVGETVDRESLWTVTSPIVLPPAVVATLPAWPDTDDFAALAASLRTRFPVSFLEAPSIGRRVEDESAVRLLEAFQDERAE
jgi:2-C-methyl-D-erythritol 4-phosphate cytidylyltransferase